MVLRRMSIIHPDGTGQWALTSRARSGAWIAADSPGDPDALLWPSVGNARHPYRPTRPGTGFGLPLSTVRASSTTSRPTGQGSTILEPYRPGFGGLRRFASTALVTGGNDTPSDNAPLMPDESDRNGWLESLCL
jgi:hypothetical protein